MGEHCELMAKQWGITREEQDALALKSHQNAAKAYDEGFHDDLIVPCAGIVQRQQCPRRHDASRRWRR